MSLALFSHWKNDYTIVLCLRILSSHFATCVQVKPHKWHLCGFTWRPLVHLCGFTWRQCTCVVLRGDPLCTCVVLLLIFAKLYTIFFENVLRLVSYFVRILISVWIFHFSLSSKNHTSHLCGFTWRPPVCRQGGVKAYFFCFP